MDKTITFLAKDSDKNLRLDKFLASKLKTLARSQIKKVIVSKGVKINKKIVISASQKIKEGRDIFDRGYELKKIEVDSSFPKYIFNNKDELEKWIV